MEARAYSREEFQRAQQKTPKILQILPYPRYEAPETCSAQKARRPTAEDPASEDASPSGSTGAYWGGQ